MENGYLSSINSSAIRVAGAGGIGMLALVIVLAIAFPAARWLLAGGVAGGAIVGAVLFAVRRRRAPERNSLR